MSFTKVWNKSIDDVTNYDETADAYVYAIELAVAGSEGGTEIHLYVGKTTQEKVEDRIKQHVNNELAFKKDVPDPDENTDASGDEYNAAYTVRRIIDIREVYEDEIDLNRWSLEQEVVYLESKVGKEYAKYDGIFDDIIGAK